MLPDFFNLSYLSKGSEIMKKGFDAIEKTYVMERLADFEPVLAGTLPLDIFVEGSDLDILCFATDLNSIHNHWLRSFSHHQNFETHWRTINNIPSLIGTFDAMDFKFELFAQSVHTREQTAYLHMINEYKILEREGAAFKQQIIELKQSGMKTEPAFAKALNLPGDPYQVILDYQF